MGAHADILKAAHAARLDPCLLPDFDLSDKGNRATAGRFRGTG